MSISRLTIGVVAMSLSVFAVNGYAQTATTSTPSAPSAATAPAAHLMKVTPAAKAGKGQVDLNTADSATLAKIKGIGPKKAQAIVEYRTKNGNFASVDDLKNVKNAKDKPYFNAKTLKKLSKKLTV